MPDLVHYMSFSGSDATVYAYLPVRNPKDTNHGLVRLDSIQTVSVSVFREKVPVRALGYANVKGHARGPRTIAGSLVFAVINVHPLLKLMSLTDYDWSFDRFNSASSGIDPNRIFPDIIPPFNLMIEYNNELGSSARCHIIGVDITNDGIVSSIEDLLTEKTMQYRCRDYAIFEGIQGKNKVPPGSGIITNAFLDSELEIMYQPANNSMKVPEASGQPLRGYIYKKY